MAEKTASSFVGMWVTEDGRIRQGLLSDGHYDEARDGRRSAYPVDGVLHRIGLRFHRET